MSQAHTLPQARQQPPLQAYIVTLIGIAAVSMGSIFIRLAQAEEVPSLFIAAARLTLAALILTPFALRRHANEIRQLGRQDLLLAGLSGLFLAGHFATWVLSLEYTSVLISVVLVNTHPLWVALLEVVFLRARLAKLVIAGLFIGITGGLIVALSGGDAIAIGQNPLLGSGLALAGAVTVAVYFTIGRKLRGSLSLLAYIWLVYSSAALILLVVVLLMGIPITGYSPVAYLWLLAMALIPQLMGHTSFNYVLKFFPATYVSIATQLEPAVSAAVAFFLFSEAPAPVQILGSAIILAGVVLATLGQNRPRA
jgi:drug/metabolite transporter (DMT)-like permease